MSISVAVVEDDPYFQALFSQLIGESTVCHLAGIAASGGEGMRLAEESTADVYIVDLGLPDMDGLDLIPLIKQKRPTSDVMVITALGDEHHVIKSIEAGATGYLLKDASANQLAQTIVSLRNGGSPISPLIARGILKKLLVNRAEVTNDEKCDVSLTKREKEILELLARGYSLALISDSAAISTHTVNQHLRNIYRKLSVRSRGEAVYVAQQKRLLRV